MSKLFFLENAASPKERSQIGEVAGKALAKAKVIAGYFLKGTLAARRADEKERHNERNHEIPKPPYQKPMVHMP